MIIETTGLADPAPVLQSIIGHPAMVAGLPARRRDHAGRCGQCRSLRSTAHVEAVKQVAVADRLVVTKAECLPIRTHVPAAATGCARSIRRRRCSTSATSRPALRACSNAASTIPATKTADVRRWLGGGGQTTITTATMHHGHDHDHEDHDHAMTAG